MTTKHLALLFSLTVLAAVGLTTSASAATTCPSFHVLHNDRIGSVKIPEGQYNVTPKGVTCANSSTLIARFLNDWDGNLPNGWTVTGGSTIKFTKARTSESISMKLAVKPSGGGSNIQNGVCPGNFTVLHNDSVGRMPLKAGQYRITTKGLYCWFDVEKLAYFLDYTESTKLPSPWTVVPSMLKIQRSPNHYFTLKYLGKSGGGGNSHPGMIRCPNKMKVTTAGLLAGISYPIGSYYVNVKAGTTCAGATSMFLGWLTDGAVANNWKVNSQTSTFTLNSKSFQIEPV